MAFAVVLVLAGVSHALGAASLRLGYLVEEAPMRAAAEPDGEIVIGVFLDAACSVPALVSPLRVRWGDLAALRRVRAVRTSAPVKLSVAELGHVFHDLSITADLVYVVVDGAGVVPFGSRCQAHFLADRLPGVATACLSQSADGDAVVSRCNLRLHSGSGRTAAIDGRGNLILGYDEGSPGDKVGSHNVVIGPGHRYASYAGLLVGESHQADEPAVTLLGGSGNRAQGALATLIGGHDNVAAGRAAVVAAGSGNEASGDAAVTLAGDRVRADGAQAVAAGGRGNVALGADSSAVGGAGNRARGAQSSVAGGRLNEASATAATVTGGVGNVAAGAGASVFGGVGRMSSDATACDCVDCLVDLDCRGEDGPNLCDGVPRCSERTCRIDPPTPCTAGDACNAAVCNPAFEGCERVPINEGQHVCPVAGEFCSDGRCVECASDADCAYLGGGADPCAPRGRCDTDVGRCQMLPGLECSSTSACQEAYCEANVGCRQRPRPDGTQCGPDARSTCSNGVCGMVECVGNADCDDGNACNGIESCDGALQRCRTEPRPPCGAETACRSFVCLPGDPCAPQDRPAGTSCGSDATCDGHGVCRDADGNPVGTEPTFSVAVFTNPGDPRVAAVEYPGGPTVTYLGSKDDAGFVTSLDAATVQSGGDRLQIAMTASPPSSVAVVEGPLAGASAALRRAGDELEVTLQVAGQEETFRLPVDAAASAALHAGAAPLVGGDPAAQPTVDVSLTCNGGPVSEPGDVEVYFSNNAGQWIVPARRNGASYSARGPYPFGVDITYEDAVDVCTTGGEIGAQICDAIVAIPAGSELPACAQLAYRSAITACELIMPLLRKACVPFGVKPGTPPGAGETKIGKTCERGLRVVSLLDDPLLGDLTIIPFAAAYQGPLVNRGATLSFRIANEPASYPPPITFDLNQLDDSIGHFYRPRLRGLEVPEAVDGRICTDLDTFEVHARTICLPRSSSVRIVVTQHDREFGDDDVTEKTCPDPDGGDGECVLPVEVQDADYDVLVEVYVNGTVVQSEVLEYDDDCN